jgi:hypothetical protein
MKVNGTGTGNDSAVGSDGSVTLIDLEAEVARLKVLRAQALERDYEFALSRVAKRFDIPKRKLRNWVEEDGEQPDAEALALSVEGARAVVDELKPDFVIERGNLPAAVYAIRDAFVKERELYERGVPVRVVPSKRGGLPLIRPLTVENVILEVHKLYRPVVKKRQGGREWTEPVNFPQPGARLYLALNGEWELLPLEGISTAPLLTEDGGIRTAEGYDPASGLWCAKIPEVSVPERPSEAEAREALHTLRRAYRTFPFADAPRRREMMIGAKGKMLEVEVVDLEQPPGRDESTLLAAQVGAICRPSLHLAPATMANAAQLSGSGSGKGLLLCGVSMAALGVHPWRFTKGGSRRNPEELEKRLAAALLGGHPYLLLENVNNHVLQSETLESALTDRPCRTRQFNTLQMVELYSIASIGMTGNGLTPSRDLVRKVIVISLDARTEVPALRRFPLADEAWLAHIEARRGALLGAGLTIWRFGRQLEQAGRLDAGAALGSYDRWCRWIRDPLIALGCRDPVGRIDELRAADPLRENLAELFAIWWDTHADRWVSPSARRPKDVEALADAVRQVADRENRGPQHLRTVLNGLDNAREAGFVFERYRDPKAPTMPSTYRLKPALSGAGSS